MAATITVVKEGANENVIFNPAWTGAQKVFFWKRRSSGRFGHLRHCGMTTIWEREN
jgi:hypothetical protein